MTENILTEQEAALEEGLAEMPEDLIPLRNESNLLKDQIDELTARREEIKALFADRLKADGLQGFILHGKVHARKSDVTNTRVDVKELKAKMPHIYAKFLNVTKSVRITIN